MKEIDSCSSFKLHRYIKSDSISRSSKKSIDKYNSDSIDAIKKAKICESLEKISKEEENLEMLKICWKLLRLNGYIEYSNKMKHIIDGDNL